MENKHSIPELRFSEFEGTWEKIKFESITTKIQSGKDSNSEIGNYPLYGSMGIIGNCDNYTYNGKYILVARVGANAGSINLVNDKFGVTDNTLIVENKERVQTDFTYYLLIKSNLNKLVFGSGQPLVTGGQLKALKVCVPTLPEQQKIASFLTAVDEKLTALKKKKELLEQYKKGVMQKLFSQQIRFKPALSEVEGDDKGKEFPKWNYKHGNEIFDSISDKNHHSDLPILAITQEHGAIPRELIDYNISVTEASVDSYKVVQKGDFIISLRSFQGGIEYSEYKGICSPAYIILRPKISIDDRFYKYYLKTESYIKELNKKLEGIRDGKMISYKYFSEVKLPYPSIEEQTKIANFLTAIDQKINQCQQQIEQTTQWKKGLLQKMFV